MHSIMHQNVSNHCHSLTCKIVPKEKRHLIHQMKWESNNCLKVKHVSGESAEIAVGVEVGVSFNVRHYCHTVTNLLDWVPPENFTVSLSGCTAPASENPLLYCFP